MYTYRARVLSVHDGDNLWVDIDLGCFTRLTRNIRLDGINAPELPTKEGKLAQGYAASWITSHANGDGYIGLRTIRDKAEKYGRLLGWVYSLDHPAFSLNEAMVDAGHAKRYDGRGPKP